MNKIFPRNIVWQETVGSFHLIKKLGLLDRLFKREGYGTKAVGFISEDHPTHILVCGYTPNEGHILISIDRNSDDRGLPNDLLENWVLKTPEPLAA